MAPLSALSPILPIAIPLILTVEEPALRLATCGAQGGAGGNGCETVGAPTTIILIPFALTVPSVAGDAIVVVLEQICPVDKLSPTLQTAGII
jgi:hypothetical protein